MSEKSQDNGAKPKLSRKLRVVLFVSLALNLLVVGLVVGAGMKHRFGPDGRGGHFDRPGGAMIAALDRQERRALGKEMRRSLRDARGQDGAKRIDYNAVIAALTADPYEPDVVRAAVDIPIRRLQDRAEMGRDKLLARLEAMSLEERKAYAQRLREVLERGPRREWGKPGGHRD
ncbi:periplasmic heavy metal sensor [Alisedimentitalea sp. MJ-SS2]|uniref:periplasmic heavy metal sensor n=1 Tax=Aliisedimentitalea sp. MJ-SS2 TaxID=3049795 RepID=UPI002912196F|nr:periplasmic heavy metal sensor [Alisedimentitalea sp. MJ-SS2]MDU8927127.1 periplasmic heavy metal sensor [Alisedimentitalea sp. MJ-SS2]